MDKSNKKAMVEPLNLLIGFVALLGAVAFFINQPNYGLILIVISTLIEALQRVIK